MHLSLVGGAREGYFDDYLALQHRQFLIGELPRLKEKYDALLMTDGIAEASATPPSDPDHCVFSRMSVNYPADLRTQVHPCFFGGDPGPLRLAHLMEASVAVGSLVSRTAAAGRM